MDLAQVKGDVRLDDEDMWRTGTFHYGEFNRGAGRRGSSLALGFFLFSLSSEHTSI